MKPHCPDCKHEELEQVDSHIEDVKGDGVPYEVPVWKCFKCDVEWEEGDL